jgi:hypothetical protein
MCNILLYYITTLYMYIMEETALHGVLWRRLSCILYLHLYSESDMYNILTLISSVEKCMTFFVGGVNIERIFSSRRVEPR